MAESNLAWISCLERIPPDAERVFWWHQNSTHPQNWGWFNASGRRFYDEACVGDDVTGTPAEEVSHWAPWPTNEPEVQPENKCLVMPDPCLLPQGHAGPCVRTEAELRFLQIGVAPFG